MTQDTHVEQLLSLREEMRRRGESVTVEQLCSRCPELIPEVRRRLEATQHVPAVPTTLNQPLSGIPVTQEILSGTNASPHTLDVGPAPQTIAQGTEDLARQALEMMAVTRSRPGAPQVAGYEILGELGRGGMGVVYKARDLRLNRMVALKMVLAGAHASASQLARFQLEAEAVASLQHPNIVQVYDVGEHDDCPYLALEFVEGGGLDRRLGEKPQPPREAAELLEQLARAMHLAHLRGIVHRDLKPANILLAGERGSQSAEREESGAPRSALCDPHKSAAIPKITDFGLAKRLEGESNTYSGSILGTPSYMAPEQATGRLREVGPHSDVYSLGAILYEMLTGQPPFRAESIMQTLSLVQNQEPVPPSQVRGEPLPRDLETICLKCLEKQPGRRYATAEALAEDLRRFLDGEPISARPVGRIERLVKWTKRRPTAAALLGVSVVAVIALVSLGLWSYQRVKAARDRAEHRSRIARQAIDDMYVQVAEQWLGDEPLRDDLKRQFLLKALRLYEELADEEEDPSLERKAGQAQVRVGQIYRQLRRTGEAEEAFNRAVAIQEKLLALNPHDPEYRQDLANTHNWRGELYRNTSRPQEALGCYSEAQRLQRLLVEAFPNVRIYRQELARSYYNRALALAVTGKQVEALVEDDRAVALLANVIKELPADPAPYQDLAHVQLNRGALLRDLRRFREAREAYEEALGRLGQLQDKYPGKPEYRFELAVVHNNMGNLLGHNFRAFPLAEKSLEQARGCLESLARDFPTRPSYQKELANTWNSLGALQARAGGIARLKRAEEAWDRSRALFDRLVERWPDADEYHAGLAQTLGNLGWLDGRRSRTSAEADQWQKAVKHWQTAIGINPDNRNYPRALRNGLRSLAQVLLRQGEHGRAAVAARQLAHCGVSPDEDRFLAAELLSRCADASEADTGDIQPMARRVRSQTLADEAMQLLARVDPGRVPATARVARATREQALARLATRGMGLLASPGGPGPLLTAVSIAPGSGRLPEFAFLWDRPDFQVLLVRWRTPSRLTNR